MDSERNDYWIGEVPVRCQLSNRKIGKTFVDGRLPGGGWASVHPTQFKRIGGKFGADCGQLYEKQPNGRWLKVEG